MSLYAQIPWLMTQKQSLITRRSSLPPFAKVGYKLRTLMNLELESYHKLQIMCQRKREITRPIRCTWMVEFKSQNRNLCLLWKRRKIKFIWNKLSNSQKDKISQNRKFKCNNIQFHSGKIKTPPTLFQIWVLPSDLLLAKLSTFHLNNDWRHQFHHTCQNRKFIKVTMSRTRKIITLKRKITPSNVTWSARTAQIT